MTISGLVADMAGVAWMNSGTVAISGAILGTVDTISYIYIMKHKSIRKHKKKAKIGLLPSVLHHFPNNLILRSVSQKKLKKGVNQ